MILPPVQPCTSQRQPYSFYLRMEEEAAESKEAVLVPGQAVDRVLAYVALWVACSSHLTAACFLKYSDGLCPTISKHCQGRKHPSEAATIRGWQRNSSTLIQLWITRGGWPWTKRSAFRAGGTDSSTPPPFGIICRPRRINGWKA